MGNVATRKRPPGLIFQEKDDHEDGGPARKRMRIDDGRDDKEHEYQKVGDNFLSLLFFRKIRNAIRSFYIHKCS